MRWSDPFEQLSVGERFESGRRAVRDTDVIVFSALTGDWHPQHCDPEWAAASPFGERIAHGMLVLSLAVGLVPLDPERVLALRRVRDVVFKRPVRLDESISVSGEITSLRPDRRQHRPRRLRLAASTTRTARSSLARACRCCGAGARSRTKTTRTAPTRRSPSACRTRGMSRSSAAPPLATSRRCRCDARRAAAPHHRRARPPFDRVRHRRARAGARRRGAADGLRAHASG